LLTRATAWRATLCVALLALTLIRGEEAGLVVQFVLGRVAYSTSNGAALYLLAASLVGVWRLQFSSGRALVNNIKSTWRSKAALSALWLALLTGHALHWMLVRHYMEDMQIDVGQHVYHWNTSGYSFTGLFHSHMGKTAAAIAAQTMGLSSGGYDTGQVFLPWVAHWAAWGIGAAFCMGLVCALWALPYIAPTRSKSSVVLYGVACALLLRGMVDGGPLAPATAPLWVGLAWVSLKTVYAGKAGITPAQTNAWPQSARIALWAAFGLLAAWWVVWLYSTSAMPSLGGFIFSASLVLVLALCGSKSAGFLRGGVKALQWLLMALLATVMALEASDQLLPLVTPLPQGCRAVALPLGNHTALGFERDCSGKTAYSVYREAGEDPRKPNHTLLWRGTTAGVHALPVKVLIVDAAQSQLNLAGTEVWPQLQLQPVTKPGGWLTLDARAATHLPAVLTLGMGDAVSRNNYNVYLWALGRALIAGGLTEFVLMPQTQHNRKENLLATESAH
jgi:hypothetical protein